MRGSATTTRRTASTRPPQASAARRSRPSRSSPRGTAYESQERRPHELAFRNGLRGARGRRTLRHPRAHDHRGGHRAVRHAHRGHAPTAHGRVVVGREPLRRADRARDAGALVRDRTPDARPGAGGGAAPYLRGRLQASRLHRRHDPRGGTRGIGQAVGRWPRPGGRAVASGDAARSNRRPRARGDADAPGARTRGSRPRAGDAAVILDGKRILVTGVISRESIAFSVAEQAQRAGAEVILTSFGRAMRLTERAAGRLPSPPDVLELDVNEPDHLERLTSDLEERWGGIDGALHAIAFAPEDALGGRFMTTPPESALTAFQTSAYSYKALAAALVPLFQGEGSLVGMD